jgi:hypothetical protein
MSFCVLLFLIAIGANIVDNLFFKSDRRAGHIRELIARLDENEMQKYELVAGNAAPDSMRTIIKRMCETIIEIGTEVEAQAAHCKVAMERTPH